jgi:hypothetical protein
MAATNTLRSTELWMPVPQWGSLYDVSDLGRVRSRPRTVASKGGVRSAGGRILTPALNGGGYLIVGLHNSGQRRIAGVHQLVVEAFLGPRSPGTEVRHLDGDRSNNRLSNLAYGTHSENMLDKVAHGTHHEANKTHCPRGHEYAGANLGRQSDGSRRCRTCQRERRRVSVQRIINPPKG